MLRTTLVALLVLTSAARAADSTSFDLDRLQVATSGGELLATETAGRVKPWSFHTDLAYRYIDRAFVHTHDGADEILLGHRSLLDVTAGAQLGRRFALGISLPVLLDENGTAVQRGSAIGDLRIVPRIEAYNGERFGLALLLGTRVPTGDTHRFLGEGLPVFEPRVAATYRAGALTVSLNLGVRIREERRFLNLTVGNEVFGSLGVAARPLKSLDLTVELHASSALSSQFGDSLVSPLELLVGAGAHAGPVRIGAAFGTGLIDSVGTPRVRFLASVQYAFDGSGKPWLNMRRTITKVTTHLAAAKTAAKPAPAAVATPAPAAVEPAVAAEAADAAPASQLVLSEEIPIIADPPVQFPRNGADLGEPLKESLTRLAGELNHRTEIHFVWVEGHADETGSSQHNLELSRRRAEEVVSFLIAQGVDATRLRATGLGDSHPVDRSGPRGVPNARNRCVTFSAAITPSSTASVNPILKGNL